MNNKLEIMKGEHVSYLTPQFANVKSFYDKAMIWEHESGSQELFSYNTLVAGVTKEGKIYINGMYSQTTARHIREYLRQLGEHIEGLTCKQLLKKYTK